eukprot:SAG31_NODE_136_length_23089_cov_8.825924_18_plen_143_part_00
MYLNLGTAVRSRGSAADDRACGLRDDASVADAKAPAKQMSANMMGAAAAGAVTMAAAVGGGMLCVSHGMCGGDQASQDASTPTKNVPPPKQSVPPPKQNVPPPKKRVSRMTKTSGLRQDRHGKIVGHGFRKGTEWDQVQPIQ